MYERKDIPSLDGLERGRMVKCVGCGFNTIAPTLRASSYRVENDDMRRQHIDAARYRASGVPMTAPDDLLKRARELP